MKRIMLMTAALLSLPALAQEPAIDTSKQATPAVDTSKTAPAANSRPAANAAPQNSGQGGPNLGLNIYGEREAPIGLTIIPWRNTSAESGIDRPARLLDEEPLPLDPGTFKRQFDYYSALSAHRNATGGH